MRPVNKGDSPAVKFKKYSDALPYLEQRLGVYCSYCELTIQHVPEVEHKESKAQGGSLLDWSNLLLSCKYCNTRKSDIVKAGEGQKYLWPDEYDTFHAYTYKNGAPALNEEYLNKQGSKFKEKAKNLFRLLVLDNIPKSPSDKDRRFKVRYETWNTALESKESWEKVRNTEHREIFINELIKLARAKGFFSIWMDVFEDDEEVQKKLIDAFPGTQKEYFT